MLERDLRVIQLLPEICAEVEAFFGVESENKGVVNGRCCSRSMSFRNKRCRIENPCYISARVRQSRCYFLDRIELWHSSPRRMLQEIELTGGFYPEGCVLHVV